MSNSITLLCRTQDSGPIYTLPSLCPTLRLHLMMVTWQLISSEPKWSKVIQSDLKWRPHFSTFCHNCLNILFSTFKIDWEPKKQKPGSASPILIRFRSFTAFEHLVRIFGDQNQFSNYVALSVASWRTPLAQRATRKAQCSVTMRWGQTIWWHLFCVLLKPKTAVQNIDLFWWDYFLDFFRFVITQVTYTAMKNTDLFCWDYGVESVLSYLPLSHVAGQMMDVFLIMSKVVKQATVLIVCEQFGMRLANLI